jgi:hypothetical protein
MIYVQGSLASPPGDEAGWFWDDDCASDCDHAIAAVDVGAGYGWRPRNGPPITAGVGLNGTYPYAEGYVQLGSGSLPVGVGARVGLPVSSWSEHQLFGRLDVPLRPGARLLLNPGVFYHTGASPNGQIDGSFLGLVQGVGVALGRGPVTVTPAAAFVLGRSERTSYGERIGPVTRSFVTASIGVSVHRRRKD